MEKLAGYRMVNAIFQSRRTAVFTAVRLADGVPVVVKAPANPLPDQEEIGQFRREFQIGNSIRHPAVVQYLAMEKWGHGLALIMEDCQGTSLDNLISKEMPLARLLHIFSGVADGLKAIHHQNVMHKDLTPSNIIWSEEAQAVKIIDFGLASQLGLENQEAVNPSQLMGSLPYLSPEQTGRMNRRVDYRTDFYSTGAAFYHLLCQRPPFMRDSSLELIHAHLAQNPLPPCELDPTIPQVLSDIIMKLMSKNAEDRYQSAEGLKTDLDHCRRLLQEEGGVTAFPLGEKEVSGKLQIPQKLYGREAHLEDLNRVLEETTGGSGSFLLITGHSGTGKSSFIKEIYKSGATAEAYFATGKFQQYKREPYHGLIGAFRSLFNMILSEPGPLLEDLRENLERCISDKERVIDDLIPELPEILGPRKKAHFLEPAEVHGRIHAAFRHLTEVFASQDHPLILFLDDLQWADNSSLELILTLAECNMPYFLLIGSYRDEAVGEDHPLSETLSRVEAETLVQRIHLQPLVKSDLALLIQDTLGRKDLNQETDEEQARVQELVSLVLDKTAGNPFFVREFLKELRDKNLIFYSQEARLWDWNMEGVCTLKVTDNVVDLMLAKLKDLPKSTRNMLALCACMGFDFNTDLLMDVSGRSWRELTEDLWPALQGGFVLPLGHSRWYGVTYDEESGITKTPDAPMVFLHDRVQQAAYELIPEKDRRIWHLRIGRRLLETMPETEQDDIIFMVVEQFNAGQDMIQDLEERLTISRLNLSAARKAYQAAAFQSAGRHINVALDLLGEEAWKTHYAQSFETLRFGADCYFALAQWDQANALLNKLFQHTRNDLQKADLLTARITHAPWHFGWADIREDTLTALKLCGFQFPETRDAENLFLKGGERRLKAVLEHPDFPFTDRSPGPLPIATALDILRVIVVKGYTSGYKNISHVGFVMGLELSMQYGFTDNLVVFLYRYSQFLIQKDEFNKAYGLAKLALSLLDHVRTSIATLCLCDIPATILTYGEALSNCQRYFQKGVRLGRDSGEVRFMITTQMSMAGQLLAMGDPLDHLMDLLKKVERQTQQNAFPAAGDHCQSLQHIVKLLQGEGRSNFLTKEGFGEEAWRRIHETILHVPLAFFQLIRDFWLNPSEALETAKKGAQLLHLCSGYLFVIDHQFLHALTITANFHEMDEQTADEALGNLKKIESRMSLLSEACPVNYQHKLELVRAEKSRILGDDFQVICEAYREAVQTAGRDGFLQFEALASELFGRFWLSQDMPKLARACLTEARYLYGRWGAKGIVARMDEQYAVLLPGQGVAETQVASLTTTGDGASLDMEAVMTAAQVIAQEIEQDKLLSVIMEVMVKYAGASRGLLILQSKGVRTLGAKADSETVQVLRDVPLEEAEPYSKALVRFVLRTGRLRIAPESQETPSRDPYLVNQPNLSILCAPIRHKKQILGLLYLENHHSSNAFNEARIGALKVLLAQTAISLENARLFKDTVLLNQNLAREMEVRKRGEQEILLLNQELEARVQERTSQLKQTQKELVAKAHMAGMAEIATSVLHNIGNVLNSVGISTQVLDQTLKTSKLKSINRANAALEDRVSQIAEEGGERLGKILEYYRLIYETLRGEQETFSENLERVLEKVELIKEIVVSQRRYVSVDDHTESLSLESMIKEALTVLEGSLSRSGVKVEAHVSPTLLVSAQRLKLFHVLISIMRNAIEAMENGDSELKQITMRAFPMTDHVRLEVTDTGEGIPADSLNKVFQHAFSTREGATGFGLHNCANAMTEMDGKIAVKSEGKGKGATFLLELPLARS